MRRLGFATHSWIGGVGNDALCPRELADQARRRGVSHRGVFPCDETAGRPTGHPELADQQHLADQTAIALQSPPVACLRRRSYCPPLLLASHAHPSGTPATSPNSFLRGIFTCAVSNRQ